MSATRTIKVNGKVETVVDAYSNGPGTPIWQYELARVGRSGARTVEEHAGRWFYKEHTTSFEFEHGGLGIEVAVETK
jgi:hypothetical protein